MFTHLLIIIWTATSIVNTSKTFEKCRIKKDTLLWYDHLDFKKLIGNDMKLSILINKSNRKYADKNTQNNIYLILLCEDIQSNPGPSKYPCTLCEKTVRNNQKALQCDEYKEWTHIKCDGQITDAEYAMFQKHEYLSWSWHSCLFANVSTSFFNFDISTNNSFSLLSTSNSESFPITATPPSKNNTLTMIGINTTSLYSSKQRVAFQAMVDTHRPDVVCE